MSVGEGKTFVLTEDRSYGEEEIWRGTHYQLPSGQLKDLVIVENRPEPDQEDGYTFAAHGLDSADEVLRRLEDSDSLDLIESGEVAYRTLEDVDQGRDSCRKEYFRLTDEDRRELIDAPELKVYLGNTVLSWQAAPELINDSISTGKKRSERNYSTFSSGSEIRITSTGESLNPYVEKLHDAILDNSKSLSELTEILDNHSEAGDKVQKGKI